MQRIVLTFGLIAGAVLATVMLITTVMIKGIGPDMSEVVGYTTMVVAFLMVYFGVRSYRDTVAGGKVGFGKAFQVGVLIMVVASVCYVGTWQVIYYKLAPDYMDRFSAAMVNKAKAAGATQAQVDSTIKRMDGYKEFYKNPFLNVAMTFLEPLPVGLVMVLVSAGVLSRKRKPETMAAA